MRRTIPWQTCPQESQIIANLNKIGTAKTQWATDTSASAGTAVTMTELTKYLNGQEIKAVVGETYDPKPVGETPTAKLPATKSLASHKAGEEIMASSTPSTASSTAASPSPSPSATIGDEPARGRGG